MAKANLNYEVPAHLKREFVFQTAGILPPNGILFGFQTINKVGEQAKKLGGKQVLLVTDETMVQLGYADLVKENLEKEGMKVGVFGKVDPEPHIETADALYDMVRKEKSDLVIGLDSRFAIEEVVTQPLMVEYDKIIEQRFEEAVISESVAYAKVIREASVVLDTVFE